MPRNSSQSSFNDITCQQHCQNSWLTNIVQVTPWQKNTTQKDYNIINHTMPQIPTRAHNKVTMSQHQTFSGTWKQHFSKQRNKEKLTLKFILECGAWVLGSWRSPFSSFHSSDGWYFFPWKVRKEGSLEEDDIVVRRKEKFENGFHKMGM